MLVEEENDPHTVGQIAWGWGMGWSCCNDGCIILHWIWEYVLFIYYFNWIGSKINFAKR